MSEPIQASCSIITASSSLTLARSLVSRIIEHATGSPNAHDGDPDVVPWTIDNKYYTAPVHFTVHTARDVDAAEPGPPALLYVFAKGKAFRDEFSKLQAAIADHDFEVTLAASMSAGLPGTHEDETDAEAFFREHGFEFVDGDVYEAAEDDERETGGVTRIVDALSTIIWPSMTRKGTQRASRMAGGPHIVLGPGSGTEADTLLSFLAGGDSRSAPRTRADEVATLERWLEEDDEDHIQSPLSPGDGSHLVAPHASWTHFANGSAVSLHKPAPEPSTSSFMPPASSSSSKPPTDDSTHGFEDDFSDFVTAPSDGDGAGYDVLIDNDDDDDDDDGDGLPSPDEILAASSRIFGPGGRAPPANGDAPPTGGVDADFDIGHAFSALQAMREEIGAISDDAERRRAAARVALGFAYGLDIGDGDGARPPVAAEKVAP